MYCAYCGKKSNILSSHARCPDCAIKGRGRPKRYNTYTGTEIARILKPETKEQVNENQR